MNLTEKNMKNMKNMKNLILIAKLALPILLSVLVITSCEQEKSSSINERIKLKEERIINSHRYTIIEVDSVEYLTHDRGGFVRLSK